MAALIGFALGAIIGGIAAARRGGNFRDILLYAVVYGMILGTIALIGAVIALNAGWL
jgi:hypothetical protein